MRSIALMIMIVMVAACSNTLHIASGPDTSPELLEEAPKFIYPDGSLEDYTSPRDTEGYIYPIPLGAWDEPIDYFPDICEPGVDCFDI